MLSSIVSLSSSSKGFVGLFYIGAHVVLSMVLAGVSGVKNGLSATSTTEIILSPTNCVLSNGTPSHPYVAAMGCAIVIFATLFFILRAKGFSYTSPCSPGSPLPPTPPSPEYPVPIASKIFPGAVPPAHNHSGMGSEPPSPPPDPGSDSADDTPRRNPWWLLLLLIVFAAGSYIYFTRSSDSSPLLIAGRIASTIDKCISDGWTTAASAISTARIYILRHGWHITKILLLGLATHCVCFIVFAVLRRLQLYLVPTSYVAIGAFLIPLAIIAFCSHLRPLLWLEYRAGCLVGFYSTVRDIDGHVRCFSSYMSSLATSYFAQVSTITAIAVVHVFAACLQTLILVLCGFPSAAKKTFAELAYPPCLYFLLYLCFGETVFICIFLLMHGGIPHYLRLNPMAKTVL